MDDSDLKSEIDFLYKCYSKDGNEWNLLKQLTLYFSLNIKELKKNTNDQSIMILQDYIDLIFKVPFQINMVLDDMDDNFISSFEVIIECLKFIIKKTGLHLNRHFIKVLNDSYEKIKTIMKNENLKYDYLTMKSGYAVFLFKIIEKHFQINYDDEIINYLCEMCVYQHILSDNENNCIYRYIPETDNKIGKLFNSLFHIIQYQDFWNSVINLEKELIINKIKQIMRTMRSVNTKEWNSCYIIIVSTLFKAFILKEYDNILINNYILKMLSLEESNYQFLSIIIELTQNEKINASKTFEFLKLSYSHILQSYIEISCEVLDPDNNLQLDIRLESLLNEIFKLKFLELKERLEEINDKLNEYFDNKSLHRILYSIERDSSIKIRRTSFIILDYILNKFNVSNQQLISIISTLLYKFRDKDIEVRKHAYRILCNNLNIQNIAFKNWNNDDMKMIILLGIDLYKKYDEMSIYVHKITLNYLLSQDQSIYVNFKNFNFKSDDVYEGLDVSYTDIKEILDNIIIDLCNF